MTKTEQLTQMLRPATEALGYDLLGIEYAGQGEHSVLRLYIDHENGIGIDDCAKVTHQVNGILALEDPISTQYRLEVSSPGLDRPLFELTHFKKVIGQIIQLRSYVAQNGRRRFKGKLVEIKNTCLTMEVDKECFEFDIKNVDKANVVAEFN
jgi:ribosome maturation factor RimP